MIRVAITGGIGSGKTTVARVFSLLGVPVYLCDLRARWLSENDPALVGRITELFGPEAYVDGRQNRPLIAARVFDDPALLRSLNEAVHPVLLEDYRNWCRRHWEACYTVMEAAVLIESGFYRYVDRIILVTAPEETRIRRAVRRDGTDRESVERRIRAQLTDEQRLPYADYVIDANDEVPVLPRILEIDSLLKKEHRS